MVGSAGGAGTHRDQERFGVRDRDRRHLLCCPGGSTLPCPALRVRSGADPASASAPCPCRGGIGRASPIASDSPVSHLPPHRRRPHRVPFRSFSHRVHPLGVQHRLFPRTKPAGASGRQSGRRAVLGRGDADPDSSSVCWVGAHGGCGTRAGRCFGCWRRGWRYPWASRWSAAFLPRTPTMSATRLWPSRRHDRDGRRSGGTRSRPVRLVMLGLLVAMSGVAFWNYRTVPKYQREDNRAAARI